MMEFLSQGPVWLLFPFLTVVVFLRAQGTYWLGRWATSLAVRRIAPAEGWRTRLLAWLNGDATDQGVAAIHRWGTAVIPFSFLTVGFQTMVNAGAGVLRMPWWKYTLAMIPGCLAWATIYSTIGFAVWGAMLAAAAGSPWGIAGMVATAIIVVATIVVRRRRRAAAPTRLTVVDGEAKAA
jgi:membrane protein DedA with SNARE-associated domain